MYMYVHTDAHVYTQTHLHTIHSQTQRHMSVYMCSCDLEGTQQQTDPPGSRLGAGTPAALLARLPLPQGHS